MFLGLSKLSDTTIRELALKMKPRQYRKGDNVWNFKEICSKWYFVYSGTVSIYVVNSDNNERKLFLKLGNGSWFNVESWVFNSYSLFLYTVDEQSVIYELNRSDINVIS